MLTQQIQESLQVTPGPFQDFWVGPGDKASDHLHSGMCLNPTHINVFACKAQLHEVTHDFSAVEIAQISLFPLIEFSIDISTHLQQNQQKLSPVSL